VGGLDTLELPCLCLICKGNSHGCGGVRSVELNIKLIE